MVANASSVVNNISQVAARSVDKTQPTIVEMFRARQGKKTKRQFWREVVEVTGMRMSYSHLANILYGRRPPNDVVLKYLGQEKVEIYRETVRGEPAGRKRER